MKYEINFDQIKEQYPRAMQRFAVWFYKRNGMMDNGIVTERNCVLHLYDLFSTNAYDNFRGALLSWFDSCDVLISVIPHQIEKKLNVVTKQWMCLVWVDGEEIRGDKFEGREQAETSAFLKAFQFVETKVQLEIELKQRFLDDSSLITPINVNWAHLDAVLAKKRALKGV